METNRQDCTAEIIFKIKNPDAFALKDKVTLKIRRKDSPAAGLDKLFKKSKIGLTDVSALYFKKINQNSISFQAARATVNILAFLSNLKPKNVNNGV